MSLLRNLIWTGGGAALLSILAAGACSRLENRRAAPAINAVSHIAWGGRPPYEEGALAKNFVVGAALHTGASFFWGAIFEGVFGRWARRKGSNALVAGVATSAIAYLTDYKLVSRRFRPGFEAYLSRPSLFAIYAALAAGLVLGARLSRRPQDGIDTKALAPGAPGPEVTAAPIEAPSGVSTPSRTL